MRPVAEEQGLIWTSKQARGQFTDARTDLFSLGAVLYQMATGELPFQGDSQAVIFEAILNREPPPLRKANPAMPEALGQILEKALEKEALEALSKAWRTGFKDADWARRDPSLALLHGEPEFEQLYPA